MKLARVSPELRELIRSTAARDASPQELEAFISVALSYGLNPLKKEIYFTKAGGKAVTMTSRDGYLAIANRSEQFDGMEADVVYKGDKLERNADGSLSIVYGENHLTFDDSFLIGAFCNVFRKDRKRTSTVFVSYDDYKKDNPIWRTYKKSMILKVAESMALKRAFSLSGLVTEEEMDIKYITQEHIDQIKAVLIRLKDEKSADYARNRLNDVYIELGIKALAEMRELDFQEALEILNREEVKEVTDGVVQ